MMELGKLWGKFLVLGMYYFIFNLFYKFHIYMSKSFPQQCFSSEYSDLRFFPRNLFLYNYVLIFIIYV